MADSLPYQITPSARKDLRDIAKYTIETWGQNQANVYAGKLASCFLAIADRKILSRQFSKKLPTVEFVRCEYHYVFFVRDHDGNSIIIAVLHERMDMLTRLGSRIS